MATPPATRKIPKRGKTTFQIRPSRLDNRPDSQISQSGFHGFLHLLGVVLIYFLITAETNEIIHKGSLVGTETMKSMFTQFDLLPAWLALISYSLTAVLLQKCIVYGWIRSGGKVANFIHGVLLLGELIGFTALVFSRKWGPVQSLFFLAEMMIIFMKMHSYLASNHEISQRSGEIDNDKAVRYPHNVTLKNYIYFLIVPTLVYQMEYPRTDKIRIGYLLEKTFALIGLWGSLHVINEKYIVPVLMQSRELYAWDYISRLLLPALLFYLICFYIVFEVICNGCAEITKFADREFYSDWWNSTNWDEFARKWNKPVHDWLLVHVYLESIYTFKCSKESAAFATFFFSSVLHEYFMTVALRIFRPWLFFMQMGQLPLILIGRHRWIKNTRAGNIFFWIGMLIGPPTLSILYCREYFRQ